MEHLWDALFQIKGKRNNKSFWKGGFWRMIQIESKRKSGRIS